MVNYTTPNYFKNVTNLKEMLQVVNSQTSGWGWVGLLGMMFVIIVMNLLGFGIEIALLSGSFIALISGLFLVYLELISWKWLMMYLGILLLVIFYITWQKEK